MSVRINTQETFKRAFNIAQRNIDEEKRTVEVAFSSEEPYERYFGIEILDHSKKSVDLSRLKTGGAVLMGHNHDDQVGVVESVRIDSDRRGRAILRFGKSKRASEIFEDVKDGIRQLISVGYRVVKYEVEEKESGPDLVRVTEWAPFEISFVSVPADATVGVGRSVETPIEDEIIMKKDDKKDDQAQPSVAAVADRSDEQKPVDLKAVREAATREEQKRIRDIDSLGDKHDLEDLAREYVDNGSSVADFQTRVLEEIGKRNNEVRSKAAPGTDESLGLSGREIDQFSMFRAMRALANPNDRRAQEAAAYELEVSSAGAEKIGIEARGTFIPIDLTNQGQVRTLSAGVATDGAELVATDLLAGSYIDVLRNSMALANAGARFLPGLVGNVDIPRQTSGAAAGWIAAEDGDAPASEPQFDQVQMTPKDVAAYTEVTRRLMQ